MTAPQNPETAACEALVEAAVRDELVRQGGRSAERGNDVSFRRDIGFESTYVCIDPSAVARAVLALRPTASPGEVTEPSRRFSLGQRVCKTKGSSWHGKVVGFYSTDLTPIGYAVESEREPGSVQIYPEAALTAALSARPSAPDAEAWQPISEAKQDGTMYVLADGDQIAVGEWDQLENDGWYNAGGFDPLDFNPTRCLLIPADEMDGAPPALRATTQTSETEADDGR